MQAGGGDSSTIMKEHNLAARIRDYEGYSYQEIAEMTNISVDQVKVYIFRARRFLKQYIGKMEVLI